MSRQIIPITSEAQWLDLRKPDITSTSMSGLLEMSPYTTPFEIYHAHKSGIILPFQRNERTDKGLRMEAYAAQEVALQTGWKVQPINVYARITDLNMGSSFDFEYEKPDGVKGILEIKAVDYFQHKQKWESAEDGGEAPAHIEVQLQHQLECVDKYEEGCIAAFTSIYDFHLYERARDRDMGADLRSAAKKFWEDVKNDNEPNPNYYRDGEVIGALYRNAGGDAADYTGDKVLDALLAKYRRVKDDATAFDKEADALKQEIHRYLENEGAAFTERFKVTAGWTKSNPGKVITEDMVGQVIGARNGYRQCLVKDLTEIKGSKKGLSW